MRLTEPFEDLLDETLRTPEEARAYLLAVMEDGDFDELLFALQDVVRAQGGMSKIARLSGLDRENLYRMLSRDGNPQLRGVEALLRSLGLRLSIEIQSNVPAKRT